MQSTANGDGHSGKNPTENQTALGFPLELKHLKFFVLSDMGRNARWCTFEQFVEFARTVVKVGDPEDLRTVFDRRDFLNWCAEQGFIEIQGDRIQPKPKNTAATTGNSPQSSTGDEKNPTETQSD